MESTVHDFPASSSTVVQDLDRRVLAWGAGLSTEQGAAEESQTLQRYLRDILQEVLGGELFGPAFQDVIREIFRQELAPLNGSLRTLAATARNNRGNHAALASGGAKKAELTEAPATRASAVGSMFPTVVEDAETVDADSTALGDAATARTLFAPDSGQENRQRSKQRQIGANAITSSALDQVSEVSEEVLPGQLNDDKIESLPALDKPDVTESRTAQASDTNARGESPNKMGTSEAGPSHVSARTSLAWVMDTPDASRFSCVSVVSGQTPGEHGSTTEHRRSATRGRKSVTGSLFGRSNRVRRKSSSFNPLDGGEEKHVQQPREDERPHLNHSHTVQTVGNPGQTSAQLSRGMSSHMQRTLRDDLFGVFDSLEHEEIRDHGDESAGASNKVAPGHLETPQTQQIVPVAPSFEPADLDEEYSASRAVDGLGSRERDRSPPIPTGCCGRSRYIVECIVESTLFDLLISTLILLNAISIGAQANYEVLHVREQETPSEYAIIERTFGVTFLFELVLRIFVNGREFLQGPEYGWNLFDTVIVAFWLMEEIAEHAAGGQNDSMDGGNFSFLRLLKILRLIRIMRLVRLLRFVSELRTMVSSICGSLKALVWTLGLMLMMMYVVGVYLTQAVAEAAQDQPDIMGEDMPLNVYYGNVFRTVFSLYQAMTGGVDWNDILVPLETHVGGYMVIVFLLYTAFAVLAMMNVVTGVFVESALATAKHDKELQVVSHIRRLFQLSDVDESDTITWKEFTRCLERQEMECYMQALEIQPSEARGLFLLLDTDESGEIDSKEFIEGFLRLRGPARAIDLATLMYFNKRMVGWWRSVMGQQETALNRIQEALMPDDRAGRMSSSRDSRRSAGNRGSGISYYEDEDDCESLGTMGKQRSTAGYGSRRFQSGFSQGRDSGRSNQSSVTQNHSIFATWEELKNAGNDRLCKAKLSASSKDTQGHRGAMHFQSGVVLSKQVTS